MKREDLSSAASHTGILGAPEQHYILHTCKKVRRAGCTTERPEKEGNALQERKCSFVVIIQLIRNEE